MGVWGGVGGGGGVVRLGGGTAPPRGADRPTRLVCIEMQRPLQPVARRSLESCRGSRSRAEDAGGSEEGGECGSGPRQPVSHHRRSVTSADAALMLRYFTTARDSLCHRAPSRGLDFALSGCLCMQWLLIYLFTVFLPSHWLSASDCW